jgi:hypothetical protein
MMQTSYHADVLTLGRVCTLVDPVVVSFAAELAEINHAAV